MGNMEEKPLKNRNISTTADIRIYNRSPRKLWGKDIFDKTREEEERALAQKIAAGKAKDQEKHGTPHDRVNNPVPGHTQILSSEDIAEAEDIMISNGLENMEAETAIETYVKAIDTYPDITLLPVDSYQGVVDGPEESIATLEINVIDILFPKRDGRIPEEYAAKVLNGLNPAASSNLIKGKLKDYLALFFDENFINWAGKLLGTMVLAWREKKAPKDVETLIEYAKHALLHEYTHGLIFNLPAEDIPEDRKAELEKITFLEYLKLILNDKNLHNSVIMFKNVIKAVRSLFGKYKPNQWTKDNLLKVIAIETFCDRFAMFLRENHRKNLLYRDIMGIDQEKDAKWKKEKGIPYEFADFAKVDQAEQARRNNKLGEYLASIGVKITTARLAKLEKDLADTEESHFLLRKYGDPKLSQAERDFYLTFLRLLRHFDGEKRINRFTRKHAESSETIAAIPLLTDAHAGLGDIIVEEADKIPGTPSTGLGITI
jgi:hypothetical protein